MKPFFAGYKYLVYFSLLKKGGKGESIHLALPKGSTPAILFTPTKREKGLIITLTGFSVSGYQDERMTVVNQAFCRLGYRVITPKINTIDNLLIHPSAIDEVKAVIENLEKNSTLNPHQFRPAIFAPSFTAGIAALAVAEMPINTVSSMCLLGGFADFESTIQFALTNERNSDDYGMHILMKNFLKYEFGENAGLEKLIQTALEDNSLKRQSPLLPGVLEEVSPETAALYKRLRNETEYRREVVMRAWTKIPEFNEWKNRLDLAKHTHRLSCAVTMIHGKGDEVIPPEQSILLHSLLKKTNKHVYLELSGLFDHGDLKLSLSIFGEIARLAKAFNHFVRFVK